MKKPTRGFFIILLLLFISTARGQDGFKAIESQVVEHTLKNGLTFLILPRHSAPVVSFHTYANVGSVNESRGITGLAHIFEHLAFKGTTDIGTKDYKKEKGALEALDKAWTAWREEDVKGAKADSSKVAKLRTEFEKKQEEAAKFVVNNEFGQAIEQNGGVGLNAGTNYDATQYFFSLPSNKLELWFSLESSRFVDPVIRDFYKEKDVVMEERRMRTESSPIGKLIEEFLSIAFKSHPYKDAVVGHMSDLKGITRDEATAFYKKYYVPSNLTIAIVGDVDPKETINLAEAYFGRIPAAPRPPDVRTVEPPQRGERRVVLHEQSQPIFLMGFKKGSVNHPDDGVYDVISDLMSSGRTSRLYKTLVRDKKIAIQAGGFSGFPGVKFPNLFAFFAIAAQGKTNEECQKAIEAEIEKLKKEPVIDADLKAVKTRARANFIRSLASNGGMAAQLTNSQVLTGNWKNLFHELDKINAVTAKDVQRVANEIFTNENRTIGTIEPIQSN
ncbi:MAG: insulinase family protein [Ignavibacteriales bacterium]|nr:insulinase family protein [Ignavibacteriales bacterium]